MVQAIWKSHSHARGNKWEEEYFKGNNPFDKLIEFQWKMVTTKIVKYLKKVIKQTNICSPDYVG
jgi:hypothetical protein